MSALEKINYTVWVRSSAGVIQCSSCPFIVLNQLTSAEDLAVHVKYIYMCPLKHLPAPLKYAYTEFAQRSGYSKGLDLVFWTGFISDRQILGKLISPFS